MKQDWPKEAQDTVDNLQAALRKEKALCAGMQKLALKLHEAVKETTYQMHNEGNGEYTIPAWFARELYDYVALIPSNDTEKQSSVVEDKCGTTGSVPPCPQCGSNGYVPWDASHIVRCSNRKCRLFQLASVLTRQQWFKAAQN